MTTEPMNGSRSPARPSAWPRVRAARLGGLAAALALLLSLLATACGTDPAWSPTRLTHVGPARQMLVAVGDGAGSSWATLYSYDKGPDGVWRQRFAPMRARTGWNGWRWSAARVQNDGTSPAGTFTLTTAFGLQANPGTRLGYRRSDGDDVWSGDPADPRTYNLYQTSVSPRRTWRSTAATAERIADYPVQYAYSVVINAYRPPDSSIYWDTARGQYETTAPVPVGHGFSIYLHVNGAGNTAGCVSVTSANLVALMRWLDPAKAPRIAMGPQEWISRV